jgi:membrane associated rhomboid family serine protease
VAVGYVLSQIIRVVKFTNSGTESKTSFSSHIGGFIGGFFLGFFLLENAFETFQERKCRIAAIVVFVILIITTFCVLCTKNNL